MKTTEYIVDPITLRMVPAPPKWWQRLFRNITRAVASMVGMQEHIK